MSTSWHRSGISQRPVGALPPGQGKRVRLLLVLLATFCLLPISMSVLAFFVGAVRSSVQDSVAVAPLSMGAGGVLAGVVLLIMLLWDRSQIVGDTLRSSSFRTVNLVLMVLGTGILVGGAVGIFAAVFGLRGALDALLAAFSLVITGIMGLTSGAMMATVANQASVARPNS